MTHHGMKPGSALWFARHEIMLSWRDFLGMMTAGRLGRERRVVAFLACAALVLHLIAFAIIGPVLESEAGGLGERLIFITAMLVLPFSLMASQAMESVTRAFYARSDLDLILASPASARKLFAVRIGAIALSTTLLSMMLAAPAINVLAMLDGVGWLAAYPVMLSLGTVATVLALSITVLMFRTIGARRTRSIAQIVAALVGAMFVIGIQVAAIASMGTMSRFSFLTSDLVRNHVPDASSMLWLPARATMGDPAALALVTGLAAAAFALAAWGLSGGFGEKVLAATGVSQSRQAHRSARRAFRNHSIGSALRYKEWKLLARDQWLISQTLMQVFYLVPPAFMLWQGFGDGGGIPVVVVPVLVMAAGQLSGGLAWLAISGEDAPQLVATAPVSEGAVVRAKIEAVLGVIGMVVSPIVLLLAFLDPWLALVCLSGVSASAVSAVVIQLWFRSQARRSNFRRRQTSSKLATFAEAFSSIFWAGAAGLAAAASWWALALIVGALAVLYGARMFRPQASREFAF
jgi:ABC-2 type transport system permease protein